MLVSKGTAAEKLKKRMAALWGYLFGTDRSFNERKSLTKDRKIVVIVVKHKKFPSRTR